MIALYRGREAEAVLAFERSLEVKRSLGDLAGARSCLLNLGLALAKLGRLGEAEAVLGESLRLSGSLGQVAGRGWCLAALADVAVRRRDPAAASAHIAEARLSEAALPAAVRADLAILKAQVALLEGDGPGALAALGELSAELRAADPLVDARALAAEAEAHLLALPVDARRAARLAIAAIRRSRGAGLPEAEAQGAAVLRAARRRSAPRYAGPMSSGTDAARAEVDDPWWSFLAELAAGASRDDAALSLARRLAAAQGAERAFVIEAADDGRLVAAWGADLDGLPIASPMGRLDEALCRAALAREGPIYQRDQPILGGRGARLAAAAPPGGPSRALVVLEHRFLPGAFDRATPAEAARWAILAGLSLRLGVAQDDTMDAIVDDGSARVLPRPRQASPPARAAAPGRLAAPALSTAVPLAEPKRSFPSLVGRSPALRRALARLDAAIDSELPVLIVGETGVGKELFARALHEHGPRAGRALVTVNCGAIPDALFEAELFGHARGSFTGADRPRAGLLARAEKGTLFLDEIGELPLLRQAGLLRALQEKRYRPVGSDEERPFDVRIVAATNRDLEQAVADKEFRQDLLYRLNAIEIHVPPLRARKEDIPALCQAFLAEAGSSAELSPEALDALSAYPFPGNVRELQNLAHRLVGLGVSPIGTGHLPRQIREAARSSEPKRRAAPARATAGGPMDERGEVTRALAETGGNISRAAALLGLTRHGLKKRMVRLGLRPAKAAGDAREDDE
ncbi:MAG: sigma 54-interacting transcriptional regulator [Byssovorax sp.]